MSLPKLTLVLGGASSGKSNFAEALVKEQENHPIYIATAQAFDDEMQTKILKHQSDRGEGWQTVEAPMEAAEALRTFPKHVALLDCATLWLTNQMLAEADLDAAEGDLLAALATRTAPTVVVSNEVGQGIVPDNALARRFRGAQGRLNQRLAAKADLVVMVIAGLPMVLKGQLP